MPKSTTVKELSGVVCALGVVSRANVHVCTDGGRTLSSQAGEAFLTLTAATWFSFFPQMLICKCLSTRAYQKGEQDKCSAVSRSPEEHSFTLSHMLFSAVLACHVCTLPQDPWPSPPPSTPTVSVVHFR